MALISRVNPGDLEKHRRRLGKQPQWKVGSRLTRKGDIKKCFVGKVSSLPIAKKEALLRDRTEISELDGYTDGKNNNVGYAES